MHTVRAHGARVTAPYVALSCWRQCEKAKYGVDVHTVHACARVHSCLTSQVHLLQTEVCIVTLIKFLLFRVLLI